MRRQGRAAPKDFLSPLPFSFAEARWSSRNPLSRIFKTLALRLCRIFPLVLILPLSPLLFSQPETVTLGPTFKQSQPPALDSVSSGSPLVVWFLREPYTICRLLLWTRSWKPPQSVSHILKLCAQELRATVGTGATETAFARKTDSPQKAGWRLASLPSFCGSLLHM